MKTRIYLGISMYCSIETLEIHAAVSRLLNNIQIRYKLIPDAFCAVLCSRRSYSCCFISLTVTHTRYFQRNMRATTKYPRPRGQSSVIILREINVSTTTTTITYACYLLIYHQSTCRSPWLYNSAPVNVSQVEIMFNV